MGPYPVLDKQVRLARFFLIMLFLTIDIQKNNFENLTGLAKPVRFGP
jgi:hypothetical protein